MGRGADLPGTYDIAYYYAISMDSKDSRCWAACKTGKERGVSAYLEITTDFHLWLDPSDRLALSYSVREMTRSEEK